MIRKITRIELMNDLKSFKGKKQYYLSIFNNNIKNILYTIEYASDSDREEHISNNSRIIENVEVKSNGFKINTSNYHFKEKTNIYKIKYNNYIYHILHDVNNDNIMIYEVLI